MIAPRRFDAPFCGPIARCRRLVSTLAPLWPDLTDTDRLSDHLAILSPVS